mgnify:FL=1
MRVLGLMSGTSADGVEAVLVDFAGTPGQPRWRIINCVSVPYSVALRKRVVSAGQNKKLSSHEWLDLTEAITEAHIHAAMECDPKGQCDLVGCHGQTVWHRPPSKQSRGASLQLLQAPLMAQLLNRPVIYDFRAADLALGGQGAPLVPALDAAIFGRLSGWRGVLNLGGIANLSLIPPNCGFDRFSSIIGWDCGPANTLLDFAVQKVSKGRLAFDQDGSIAATGSPNEEIIQHWLKEPFFQKLPPKSTGREQFGLNDLENRLKEVPKMPQGDLIATLTAFSAAVVAQDLDHLQLNKLVRPIELLIAGGGCRNPVMVRELMARCRGMRVLTVEEKGVPVQAREALAFALLAWWHSVKHEGNSPAVTGALRSLVLGVRVDPG